LLKQRVRRLVSPTAKPRPTKLLTSISPFNHASLPRSHSDLTSISPPSQAWRSSINTILPVRSLTKVVMSTCKTQKLSSRLSIRTLVISKDKPYNEK
jgi:hypothetical protein